MISKFILIFKKILHFINLKKIGKIGNNSSLFCRIDKRHINSKILIGNDCLINGRLVTETETSQINIKDNVFIGGNTIIDCKHEIIIENDVLVSYECIIFDHDSHSVISSERKNDLSDFKDNNLKWKNIKSKKILIKKNAWICARSIILKGVTIGEGSIVAAGSVVTEDVPDYSLVAGNPAKFLKKVK
jgi:acetyltransferase-like isoleucine patch superfamily enzyme